MSPRWAEVDGYGLYFYGSEPHRRPHVAVTLRNTRVATLDVETGEVLAESKSHPLPPRTPRRVQRLLVANREAAVAAFEAMLRHELPNSLDDNDEEEA